MPQDFPQLYNTKQFFHSNKTKFFPQSSPMESLKNMFDFDYHFPVDKELTILQYIWVGGTGIDVRGKTMVTRLLALISSHLRSYIRSSPESLRI